MKMNENQGGLRRLSVMGSTGSIGSQTLDIVAHYPEKFEVVALTANSNWEKLAAQARKFRPQAVVISDERYYGNLKESLSEVPVRVMAGKEALVEAATMEASDIVVGALVGYSGLPSTLAALEADKTVALANKETLVVAGELIEKIIDRKGKRILPVDSEHSAIFQCLQGEESGTLSKIILTASGGPFRTFTKEMLRNVTVEEALQHPNWHMGAKVTIDSATMMNKGFEMIEARWLFHTKPSHIEVLVHPESIVHSMVEFIDGSVKAQLGLPDMRLPIEVALSYPDRLDLKKRLSTPSLCLSKTGSLTFEKPDMEKFPLLSLAYETARNGGLEPAVMNAANEVAVKAFLEKRIGFMEIAETVISTVEKTGGALKGQELTTESIAAAHKEGTKVAEEKIKEFKFSR